MNPIRDFNFCFENSMTATSPQTADDFTRAQASADFILSKTKLRPRIALVLGSGMGGFAASLASTVKIPYHEIPGFVRSTAEGHAGQMVVGTAKGAPVATMQGRMHYYEGDRKAHV